MSTYTTIRIQIEGVVQGVGFRPFVYNLAARHGIGGHVYNDSSGVEILAQGDEAAIREFVDSLRKEKPPQAVIDELRVYTLAPGRRLRSFTIKKSRALAAKNTRIAPDLCLCPDCLRELFDPQNRRYFYPFINCTNCGPRYTIVRDVPYDRKYTTMHGFTMCERCKAEYEDPHNRRFHAQPNACYTCGPVLELCTAGGKPLLCGSDAGQSRGLIRRSAELLEQGALMAVKGIGGFHLACDARSAESVRRLRSLKIREARPFALMAKDPSQARTLALINPEEERRLSAADRPIVLLPKNPDHPLAGEVSPRNAFFGVMLPYAPLHYLLFAYIDFPLVMTSGNLSDEPIAHTNDDAFARLGKLCDYFLTGNRDIHIRCDDSVTRMWRGAEYPLRRSRGTAPNPVLLGKPFAVPLLAVGAEQKNTICLAKNNKAFLSHHIGDLKNAETYLSFSQAVRHLMNILDVRPQAVAYDLHPQYLSTRTVLDPHGDLEFLGGLPRFGIQHHHAHIAACMAEHDLRGPVLGVALDGTGYGTDGTIWGGEVLIADLAQACRAARLLPFGLPGADKAILQPWRTGLSLLYSVYGEEAAAYAPRLWPGLAREKLTVVLFQLGRKRGYTLTSSCGRLFDAVSALAGVCTEACYEGEPAVELEQAIENDSPTGYTFNIVRTGQVFDLDWRALVTRVTEDRLRGAALGVIACRFHNGLVGALRDVCLALSGETTIKQVVLSGGCFMNMFLLSRLTAELEGRGLTVYTHNRVPCNDGGIALGQAVIADTRLKEK